MPAGTSIVVAEQNDHDMDIDAITRTVRSITLNGVQLDPADLETGLAGYGFYPHPPYAGYPPGDRPAGFGERYRATVIGPGVLPDIVWQGDDLGLFNADDPAEITYEQQMNTLGALYAANDKLCRQR